METENKKIWVIGLGVVFTVMFGMWVFSPAEVVVTGTGMVSVPATSATFNVTVNVIADSADVALTDLRKKIEGVRKQLTEMNIRSEDIAETQITLTPAAAVVAGAKGYQAMTTLSIKTTNVAQVPEMIVNMYVSGATIVSQPVVSVEDQDKLEQEALNDALKDAKNNLGMTVGFRPIRKIVGIEQASSGNTATSIKAVTDNKGSFEVTKAVQVLYRVW